MNTIKFNSNDSNIILFIKGHFGNSEFRGGFWNDLEKIYMELYAMDESSIDGIFHMIRDIWFQFLQNKKEESQYRMLEEYEKLSMPRKNWEVADGITSEDFIKLLDNTSSPNKLLYIVEQNLIKMKILAMCSQIRLSWANEMELEPKIKNFCGISQKDH